MMSELENGDDEPVLDATTVLSEREEMEAVYRHVFMGETMADIGDVLGVSSGTIHKVNRAGRKARGLEHAILDAFTDDEDPRDDVDDHEFLTAVIDMDGEN